MKKKFKITRNEAIFYFGFFVFFLILGLSLLSSDNIGWITASPEWESSHTVCNNLDCWTGAVKDYNLLEKLDYVARYRIYTVFTHPRDLIPLSIMSLVLTSTIIFIREIFRYNLFKELGKWINK